MKNFKNYFLPICGLIFFFSEYTNAACIQNPDNNQNRYIPNDTIYVQYDNLTANNSTLKTTYITGFTYGYGFAVANNTDCGGYIDLYYVNGWSANSSKIAPTNIPGVGIKVSYAEFISPQKNSTTDQSYGWGTPTNWRLDLIKTGAITASGTIKNGEVAYLTQYNTKSKNRFIATKLIFQNNYKIIVLSCSLKNNQSVYNIKLGDWYDTQFKNLGDTSIPVDIPITLTCMAGANIKATITSASGYVDTNTGKLALSGADKATGVAIQLLDKNNAPIKLNTKNSLQNNVPAGDYLFNWKARYIKTAETIIPGSANATATVNIRYE